MSATTATDSSMQPQHPVATQKSGPFPFLGGAAAGRSGGGVAVRAAAGRASGAGGRGGAVTRGGMEPGGSDPVGGTAARTDVGAGGGAAGRGGGTGAVW